MRRGHRRGAPWLERLASELRGASVAFILASSDYLVSTWCRRELKIIRQKVADGQIANAFWIQVRPCVWERTELADFQSQMSARGQVFSEIEGGVLDREILAVVREVASSVDVITRSLDSRLTFVKAVAGEIALQKNLAIEASSPATAIFDCVSWTDERSDRFRNWLICEAAKQAYCQGTSSLKSPSAPLQPRSVDDADNAHSC